MLNEVKMKKEKIKRNSYLVYVESIVDKGPMSVDYGEWFWCEDFNQFKKFVKENCVKVVLNNIFNFEESFIKLPMNKAFRKVYDNVTFDEFIAFREVEKLVEKDDTDYEKLSKTLFQIMKLLSPCDHGGNIQIFNSKYNTVPLLVEHFKNKGMRTQIIYNNLEEAITEDIF